MKRKAILIPVAYLVILVANYLIQYIECKNDAELELNIYATYEPGVVLYTDNASEDYPFGGEDGACYVKKLVGENLTYQIKEDRKGKIRLDIGYTDDPDAYVVINSMAINSFFERRVWSGADIASLATIRIDYEVVGDALKLFPCEGHDFIIYTDVLEYDYSFNYVPLVRACFYSLCILGLIAAYFLYFDIVTSKQINPIIINLLVIGILGFIGGILLYQYEHTAYGIALFGEKIHGAANIIAMMGIVIVVLCAGYVLLGKAGAIIGTLFIAALEIAGYYYSEIRGEWLCPWDFQSSGEAAKVVTFDSLKWSGSFVWLILFIVTAFALTAPFFFKKNREERNIKKQLTAKGIALATGVLVGAAFYLYVVQFNSFGIHQYAIGDSYSNNGFLVAFSYFLHNSGVKKVNDYSESTMLAIENEVVGLKEPTDSVEEMPNIIVIMDEAFWDPSIFSGLQYEEEFLRDYYDILGESMHGYVLSPHFGGGTCDVEFEALTGFSMDYIQNGLMPYQGIVWKKDHFFSVVDHLKSQGYQTIAMHPNTGAYYHRGKCYDSLGFDKTIFEDEFEGNTTRAWFLDDEYTFQKIIEVYEDNRDTSNFIFAVTIQSHNPYGDEVYDEDDVVKYNSASNLSEEVIAPLQDFSNSVNLTSKALKELVDFFRDEDRPTIIVFWGDHMVNLGNSQYQLAYETNYLNDANKDEADYLMYQTPFFVWDNYREDMAEEEIGTISTFQLLPTVFEKYDLDEPSYFNFLNSLKKVSTGRSHGSVILDNNGNPCEETEEIIQKYKQMELLEYDYIYGEQYAESLFN